MDTSSKHLVALFTRAQRERDPQKLREYLAHPDGMVQFAALLNPRTPHDAVRQLADRYRSEPGILRCEVADLVLHPALTQEQRLELLVFARSLTRDFMVGRLVDWARASRSSDELDVLGTHPSVEVAHAVARNPRTSRTTRAYLSHRSLAPRATDRFPRVLPVITRPADPARLRMLTQLVEFDLLDVRD